MIAFTILGLLVFWAWCFQFGYWLAFAAQVGSTFFALWLLDRKVGRDIAAFAREIAAYQASKNPGAAA